MAQKSFTGNIGTPSGGFGLYLLIDYSQSIAGNYTEINRIRGYVKRNNSSYVPYNSSSSVTVKVAGVSYTASGAYDLRSDGYKLIIDKSPDQKIYHNAEGELSATFSLAMNGKLSSYYPNGTISATLPFPVIPRMSDLTLDVITVPADGTTEVIATAIKKSDSFTDQITVSLGTYSQDITSGTPFTIPSEWINAITGTTAIAVVKTTTKSGTTVIGSKTVNLTVTVPASVVPSISSVSVTEAISAVTTALGNRFVKGLSQLNVAITASGVYGSTIKSYSTALNGVNYIAQAFTSNVINAAGTINAAVIVTDSRGRTAQSIIPIVIVDYVLPTITAMSYVQCDADGTGNSSGTCTKIKIAGAVSSVDSQNSKALKIKYKATSDDTYTERTVTLSDWDFDTETIISSTDPSVTYEYIAELTDKISTTTFKIMTGVPVISRLAGGKGVEFFGEASREGIWANGVRLDFTQEQYDYIASLIPSIGSGGGLANLVDFILPVGHVITTTNADYSPNTLYPWMTWTCETGQGIEQRELLWTNPGQTSVFTAQTINLDLSDYDIIELEASQAGNTLDTEIHKIPVGSSFSLQKFTHTRGVNAEPVYIWTRLFTINNNSVICEPCYLRLSSNNSYTSVVNECLIPNTIYGIRKLYNDQTVYYWRRTA